jgi:putative transposase
MPWLTCDRFAVPCFAHSRRVKRRCATRFPSRPRSPWQNPYVERLIGTLRRELFNHVIVLNEAHLRRLLTEYLAYYHEARTHQGLEENAPRPREIEPPERGPVLGTPHVGGLHHGYHRAA